MFKNWTYTGISWDILITEESINKLVPVSETREKTQNHGESFEVNILLICILHYAYISDNYALQLNHIIVKIHHSFTKQQIVHVCLLKSMACSISQDVKSRKSPKDELVMIRHKSRTYKYYNTSNFVVNQDTFTGCEIIQNLI
jgi:hypothetical protein